MTRPVIEERLRRLAHRLARAAAAAGDPPGEPPRIDIDLLSSALGYGEVPQGNGLPRGNLYLDHWDLGGRATPPPRLSPPRSVTWSAR